MVFFAFLLVFQGRSARAAQADGPPPEKEIIQRLQAKYESATTLSADFEQENELRTLGRKTRSRGHLILSKPGRIRFEYVEPESQLLVSDGNNLWIYTARLKQVIVARLAQGGADPTPLLFLAGKGNLTESFRVKVEELGVHRRAEGVWKAGQPHRLALAPLRPEAGFQRLWLEVDPDTFQIAGLEFSDVLGNRTRLRFANVREGVPVSPDQFRFEVPPGVEVLRAPGSR